jgi:hypothetical protein
MKQTFIASIVDTADQPTILAIAQEELQAIASRSAHDSYIGNTIACTLDPANEERWLVAHPKGDLGNELGELHAAAYIQLNLPRFIHH